MIAGRKKLSGNFAFSVYKERKRYPVQVPTVRRSFPEQYVSDLVTYVRKGGTLILPCSFPLRYDFQPADSAFFLNSHRKKAFPAIQLVFG